MTTIKPIVLIANSDGKIELSQDEFKKLIEDAYEEGKKDGRASGITITSPTYPNTAPHQNWWYEVTCSECACNGHSNTEDNFVTNRG